MPDHMPAKPLYGNPTRVAADAQIGTGAVRLMAILVLGGAGAAATLDLTNSADGSGTPLLDFNAPAGDIAFADFTDLGGILFATAMYADIGGAGAVAYLWIED